MYTALLAIFQEILEATKKFKDEQLFLSHVTRFMHDSFPPDTFTIYLHHKAPPHLRPYQPEGDLLPQPLPNWLNQDGEREESPNTYCLPLTVKKQQLGLLYTQSPIPDRYNAEHKQLLAVVADQIALAIHWLRAEAHHLQRTHQEVALSEMGKMITSSLELEQVLQRILDYVTYLVRADGVSVMLLDADEQTLTFVAVSGPGASRLLGYKMPAAAGIAGRVVQTGSTQQIYQRQDATIYENAEQTAQYQAQTLFAIPLKVNQQIIGVLEAVHHQPYAFGEEEFFTLTSAATWAAIAVHNAMLYEAERNQFRKLQESQAMLIQAEKLAALGRMTASVAHEINNPIQAIQGCLNLALEDLTSNPQAAITYLNIVQTEIDRIAALARRMHDFYRPDSQEAYYQTNLSNVIQEVLRLAHKHLQNRQVQLICNLDQQLPPVQAQPNQLKQVFLNIILNALDAMPDGGVLQISLSNDTIWSNELGKQMAMARLEFNNSGEPIPAHLLSRLFEPFFSTKAQGSGLGLSISYTIIKAHQGDIFITSDALSGTTTTVLLPLIGPHN